MKCRKRIRPPKSVWDSLRLEQHVKDKLLDMVVKGLSTSSSDERDLSSRPTRDKFSRLARACYAYAVGLRCPIDPWIPVADEPGVDPQHWPSRRTAPRSAVVFKLSERRGKVQVRWIGSKPGADAWREVAPNTGPGLPCFDDKGDAYVWFALQGGRVAIPRSRRPQKRLAPAPAIKLVATPEQAEASPQYPSALIEKFWKDFLRTLRPHTTLSRKDLHLCLGEACYRFNTRRRTKNWKATLEELMKRRTMIEIESVLSR